MKLSVKDLKDFKHEKSDDDSTTLRHKDGHSITLHHPALDKNTQVQLKALAEMAKKSVPTDKTDKQPKPPMKESEDDKTKIDYKKVREEKRDINLDESRRPKYAEGTPDEPIRSEMGADQAGMLTPTISNPAQSAVPTDTVQIQKLYNSMVSGNPNDSMTQQNTRPWATFGPNGEPPKSFDSQAWQQAEQQFTTQAADQSQVSQEKVAQIQADNQVRQRAGLPPMPVPGMVESKVAEAEQAPTAVPQAGSMAPQPQPQTPGMPGMGMGTDPESMLQGAYNKQVAGQQGMANAQAKLGEQQEAILQKSVTQQQDAQIAFKQQYDTLEAERQAHMKDVQNGHIDPNKYWENHSKIATAIGLILGGFNPNGNSALEIFKYQMDKSIEAQAKNLDSDQNLLSANLKQFGNLHDATAMTRLMLGDQLQAQLKQAAAKASGPMAKAAALDAIGKIQMQMAPMFQQFAMRRSLMSMNGQNPGAQEQMLNYLTAMNPELAKQYKEAFVPGIGMSSSLTPIPQTVREQLVAHQKMAAAAKDLQEWTKTHNTITMNPMDKDYTVGLQKSQMLQQIIRHSQLQTVYREGEQPLLDKMISGNPAGLMKNFKTMPQLHELLRSNEMQFNMLKKSVGLPETAVPQQSMKQDPKAAMQWLQNPKNKKHPQYDTIRKLVGG